jgi:hypothetical protein
MSFSSTTNVTDIMGTIERPPLPPIASGSIPPLFTQGQKWPINPVEVTKDITDIKEVIAFDPVYAQIYFLANADNLSQFKFYHFNPYQAWEMYSIKPGGVDYYITYYIRDSFIEFNKENPPPSSSNDPAVISDIQLRNLMNKYSSMEFRITYGVQSAFWPGSQFAERRVRYPVGELFNTIRRTYAETYEQILEDNPTYNVRRKMYWQLVDTFTVYETRKRTIKTTSGTSVTLSNSMSNSFAIEANLGVEIGPVSSSITSKFSSGSQQSTSYVYSEQREETIEDTYSKVNNKPTTYYFWRLCHEFNVYKGNTNEFLFTLLYPFFPLVEQIFQAENLRSQEKVKEAKEQKTSVNDDITLELKSRMKALLIPILELDERDLDERLNKLNWEEIKAKTSPANIPDWDTANIPDWEKIKEMIDSADTTA